MFKAAVYSHYRTLSEALATIITFGVAILIGHLIVSARL